MKLVRLFLGWLGLSPSCRHCHRRLDSRLSGPFHGGMSDVGTAYCRQCGRSLHFSFYSERYTERFQSSPWSLNAEEKLQLDNMFVPCPCGGQFSVDAAPRCPFCGNSLAYLVHGPSMYLKVSPFLYEERGDTVWSAKE